MRLICPNCDAQYEVPDDVVPAEGRDVQCSNCANTWFFKPVDPADAMAEEAEAETSVAPPPPPPAPTREPEPVPEQPQRRELDPAVADVLREEAEYEARARAAEQAQLETQPDLGLDDLEPQDEAARRAAEARTRMARMRGEAPLEDPVPEPVDPPVSSATVAAGAVAAATAAEQTRRGLLPDVDAINSTLRSDDDRAYPQETEAPHRDAPKRKRGGFWRGFMLIVVLVAIAIALYIFAPQISAAVPQLADPLAAYVAWVDGLRGWLDGQVLSLLSMLDGLSSEAPAPSE